MVLTPSRPAPPCELLQPVVRTDGAPRSGGVRAPLVFGSLADDFHVVEITLRFDHPATTLRWLGAYGSPYADLDPATESARVRYDWYPTSFAFDLALVDGSTERLHRRRLGVFETLHLRAEAPGCGSVEILCDDSGACRIE